MLRLGEQDLNDEISSENWLGDKNIVIGAGSVGERSESKDKGLRHVILHWENMQGEQRQPRLLFTWEVNGDDGEVVMRREEVLL